MSKQQPRYIEEAALGSLAKKYREAAGKSRAEAARELGVARPTVFQAEENPDASLFKLRKRLIELYSPHRLIGPVFWLEEK
jgi:DNA-binding XRE family transcriptional regulator